MKKVVICFFMVFGLATTIVPIQASSETDAAQVDVINYLLRCTPEETAKILKEAKIFVTQAHNNGLSDKEILALCAKSSTRDTACCGQKRTSFCDVLVALIKWPFIAVGVVVVAGIINSDKVIDILQQLRQ